MLFAHRLYKFFQHLSVLNSRLRFKLRVQVYSGKLRMAEFFDTFGIVWPDASAEKEWRFAVVCFQNVPVERFSTTAFLRRFGVE